MIESNPFATVQQIAGGYCLPRCLHVVADLGVHDVGAGLVDVRQDLGVGAVRDVQEVRAAGLRPNEIFETPRIMFASASSSLI